jgi:hypothetical protein
MAAFNTRPYLKHLLHASVQSREPKEDIIYPVICEFILQHKTPEDRFIIYPQISLRWKPNNPQDTRAEVPDIGVGNFSLSPPYFMLRIGAEAKRCLPDIMRDLPDPATIEHDRFVMAAFHALYFQGEDQAKAAIKGCHTFSKTIKYLLFVGPYWTLAEYGPFTSIQLEIRTHKPSGSSDFKESSRAIRRLNLPAVHRTLHLLGTIASTEQLESILASTDEDAAPLRAAASAFNCESIYNKQALVLIQLHRILLEISCTPTAEKVLVELWVMFSQQFRKCNIQNAYLYHVQHGLQCEGPVLSHPSHGTKLLRVPNRALDTREGSWQPVGFLGLLSTPPMDPNPFQ